MAEPNVIERMVSAYRNELTAAVMNRRLDPNDPDVGNLAMLAAVRELRDCMAEDANLTVNWRDVISSYLLDVMTEHEKVSKSDKPLSPTNPPSE